MAEKERARASFGAPLPSLSFTVTITLPLAPVPFPSHERLIDQIIRTRNDRSVSRRIVREIVATNNFRCENNIWNKIIEEY